MEFYKKEQSHFVFRVGIMLIASCYQSVAVVIVVPFCAGTCLQQLRNAVFCVMFLNPFKL